jgi:hypothetical protein
MSGARITRVHPVLGELVFDERYRWWVGSVAFGGRTKVKLTIDAPAAIDEALLATAVRVVSTIDCDDLKAVATRQLYPLYHRTWRSEDGPDVDADGFRALLRPRAIHVQDDGAVSVSFDDRRLFAGHDVVVGLDAELDPRGAELSG